MTRLTPEQQEIIALLVAAADGDTTEKQCARVEQLVKENEEMQLFVLQLLNQEAWLSLHGMHESTAVRPELAGTIRGLLTEAEASTVFQAVVERHALEDSFAQRSSACHPRKQSRVDRWQRGVSSHSIGRWVASATYAALLLGIGLAIGMWAAPGKFRGLPALVDENAPDGGHGVPEELVNGNYHARLVDFTSCVWGQEMRPGFSNSLRTGESLDLIHGLAELDLDWSLRGKAKVRLEGPAAIVLLADGGVNLNHGKLTANISLEDESFAVETPLGRFEVSENATIGVSVSPVTAEIHVFDGEARVVTSWASAVAGANTLDVRAGESIQLATTQAGDVQIRPGIAEPGVFVSQTSMTQDLLDISADYVAAIKEASPVCYWRFNQPVDGFIQNEMADRYHGQVFGNTEWVKERDNWTVQCGGWLVTDTSPSHIVADRLLESPGVQSYSLEVWVKPSHFHLATITALLSPDPKVPGRHGMLLELGGPSSIYVAREHPGRVRYLHRNPPEISGGTSCFSNLAYGLRKWQHIVAVKDNSEMRLYIDGREVTKCEDATPLPDHLLLLVGQLDRERNSRLFIGQLDELAYYERALTEEEIQQHYRLARPAKALPGGI